ncbi:hypothetical protein D3C78_1996340 [compost metagenome]
MAHMDAAHSVSSSAKNGTLAPFSLPIRVSPAAATTSPSTLAARSRSPRKIAAKNRVKKA